MKTALTQLIEKWETEIGSYIPNAPIYAAFIAEAKELLEAEKEQIKEAYADGFWSLKYESPEEYYTKTFKSDE